MYTTSHSSSSPHHSLDYGSRGPSLDESIASDPFVDRSLYDPSLSSRNSSSNSRSSSRARPITEGGRNPWSPLSSEHGDSSSPSPPPPPTTSRPGLPTSHSDLSRQISAAISEELPNESESEDYQQPPTPNANGNETGWGSSSMMQNGRKRSESGATLKARNSNSKGTSSPSFLSQFRSGSGWFAPMVEAEKPLSREEYAAKEKARIEKLKAGKSASRRPGLMKRLSSGLELSGFGGGGGGGGSPSKR
ncbi:hypothetical protein JCM5350_004981 [Sporobolomyces pararoseus]